MKIKNFLKRNIFNIFLSSIILAASFLRLYNLPNTLMFQGDQGRDAITVARIFKDKDLVFIGPVTSVGNMYLGPFYYYFMLPFLFLTYPSPLGPAFAVAALSIITTYLMYWVGKKMFSQETGLLAAIFFGFSAVAVEYARFSWNPNPAPFFSLLLIYFTYLFYKKNNWYAMGISLCFSILIQLHYVALLSAAGVLPIIFLKIRKILIEKKRLKNLVDFLKPSLVALLIFILSLTPLILFDFKHNFLNAKAFSQILTKEEGFESSRGLKQIIKETEGKGTHVLYEIAFGENKYLKYLYLFTIAIFILKLYKNIKQKNNANFLVLASFLFTGIIGLSFYNHSVFDHYILYLLPISFLTYAVLLVEYWRHKFLKFLSIIFIAVFLLTNLKKMPLETLGWTLDDVKLTTGKILENLGESDSYNIILLSESRDLYGQSYRYYLESSNHPPLRISEYPQAEKLVIINENQKGINLTDLPIYEIQTFPGKKVSTEFEIADGPQITIFSR